MEEHAVSNSSIQTPAPRYARVSACFSLLLVALLPLAACRKSSFPRYPANYREYAYVTIGGNNTVAVLDLVNLRPDRVLNVGADPTGITANPRRNEVYAVNSRSGTISVIDTVANKVAATIPVHRQPYFIDVSADGTRAFVANAGSNNVSVIDLNRRREIAAIGVGEGPGLARISRDATSLVVTNRVSGSITIIDAATLKVRSVFSGCPGATDAVILPDSSKAFIACSGGHQVMVIALARAATPATAAQPDRELALLDVGHTPVQLALKPDGGEIFVSNFNSDTISEIATDTNEVGGAYLIGAHPAFGIVSADNSTLWVSNFNADTVEVYSIDDGKRINSVHVGDGPDALAFSSAGNLLLSVNTRSGDLAVVRTLSYTLSGQTQPGALFTMLPAGKNPHAIAVKSFRLR